MDVVRWREIDAPRVKEDKVGRPLVPVGVFKDRRERCTKDNVLVTDEESRQ